MAEQIISKRCSKCKQIKSISEFHKNKTEIDGRNKYCKICRKEYDQKYYQSEIGIKIRRKANQKFRQSAKGKEARKKYGQKYQQSRNGKKAKQKYEQSEKGKERLRIYRVNHPEKVVASNAVNNAIQTGKLPRPNTKLCHYCPNPAQQYHHWQGYASKHRLDVIPVCKICHKITHL